MSLAVAVKAYKGNLLARFLQNKLFLKLNSRRVIVKENCRIHKERTVVNVLQHAQQTPLFLSAYAPHFNMAEWVFGRVKRQVKKYKAQKHTLAGVIQRSLLRSVAAVNVTGWLEEVKRNFLLALKEQPLDLLMNPKQALALLTESKDPYPEVKGEAQKDDLEL